MKRRRINAQTVERHTNNRGITGHKGKSRLIALRLLAHSLGVRFFPNRRDWLRNTGEQK
jgi:hypothetical protein